MGERTIWIDASTPKRALLAAGIARLLRSEGYETIITARSYDYTVKVLEAVGEQYLVAGVHGGKSLRGKLLADIGRMVDLDTIVDEWEPRALISYPSPPAARVAFGRAIPYIALGDTPHGEAMNRLSYPLAKVVIVSEFIASEIERYVLKSFTALEVFRGIDEILYISQYSPNAAAVRSFGLEPLQYVILRPEEFKAHYYREIEESIILKLVEDVKRQGLTPVVLPRYKEQHLEAVERGAKIIDKPFVGLDLVYFSVAVVTGGISMAREAALLGIPGISVFHETISIDKALMDRGFPIRYAKGYEELRELLLRIMKNPEAHRIDSRPLLSSLESPGPAIKKWLRILTEGSP